MVNQWPAMSHYFDIHPWDIDRLTYAELDSYHRALKALTRPR